MADQVLEGGCLCGAVRYRIAGAPFDISNCHCRSCRRASGAANVAWAMLRSADFEVTAGRLAAFASSPGVTRGFCAACGTTLTFRDDPDSVDVTLASLDDPEALRPVREGWVSHRLSWSSLDPDLPRYPRGRSAGPE